VRLEVVADGHDVRLQDPLHKSLAFTGLRTRLRPKSQVLFQLLHGKAVWQCGRFATVTAVKEYGPGTTLCEEISGLAGGCR